MDQVERPLVLTDGDPRRRFRRLRRRHGQFFQRSCGRLGECELQQQRDGRRQSGQSGHQVADRREHLRRFGVEQPPQDLRNGGQSGRNAQGCRVGRHGHVDLACRAGRRIRGLQGHLLGRVRRHELGRERQRGRHRVQPDESRDHQLRHGLQLVGGVAGLGRGYGRRRHDYG